MGVCLGVPDFSINCFVLIHFHFAHALKIIKVDNKVIDYLNSIYLNLILYFIYLVSESGLITYLVNPETLVNIVLCIYSSTCRIVRKRAPR